MRASWTNRKLPSTFTSECGITKIQTYVWQISELYIEFNKSYEKWGVVLLAPNFAKRLRGSKLFDPIALECSHLARISKCLRRNPKELGKLKCLQKALKSFASFNYLELRFILIFEPKYWKGKKSAYWRERKKAIKPICKRHKEWNNVHGNFFMRTFFFSLLRELL